MPKLTAASAHDARHIAQRFEARPAARALFDGLCAHMAGLGPMQLVATKSRVSFLAGTRFAWVPEAFADGSIYVRFLLARPLDGARWRSGPVGGRWSHGTKVRELDDELKGLLAEAYALDRSAILDAKPKTRRAVRRA